MIQNLKTNPKFAGDKFEIVSVLEKKIWMNATEGNISINYSEISKFLIVSVSIHISYLK